MTLIIIVCLLVMIGAILVMWHEADIAPIGWEDDDGFHYGEKK